MPTEHERASRRRTRAAPSCETMQRNRIDTAPSISEPNSSHAPPQEHHQPAPSYIPVEAPLSSHAHQRPHYYRHHSTATSLTKPCRAANTTSASPRIHRQLGIRLEQIIPTMRHKATITHVPFRERPATTSLWIGTATAASTATLTSRRTHAPSPLLHTNAGQSMTQQRFWWRHVLSAAWGDGHHPGIAVTANATGEHRLQTVASIDTTHSQR